MLTDVLWCNIPVRRHVPVHIGSAHKWNTRMCMSLGYSVHHLVCTAQPRECTGMGAGLYIFSVG